MSQLFRGLRDLFVSLKLTIFLLVLSIVLVFWATLAQTDLGVWGVQQKFFHSLFVLAKIPGTELPVPIFPGGYFIGGLLMINLIAAQLYRFRYTWKKSGIWLTHLGLILLLVGELLSGLQQENFDLIFDMGETKSYAENELTNELAITETTDPKWDSVVAIPENILADGGTIQRPELPFRAVARAYYPNAQIKLRSEAPNAPPTLATAGTGGQIALFPLPRATRLNDRDQPAAYVDLIAADGTIGTFLVSADQDMLPQHFATENPHRTWKISLRPERRYFPFSLTLLKFSNDLYPGTDIPKNYSSRVTVDNHDGSAPRESLIYMNNPLRYGGYTFFQKSFDPNDPKNSILQVVRNPSWRLPYIACAMMALGLVIQFLLHLSVFARRQRKSSAGAALA
jgi:hypothetical protein